MTIDGTWIYTHFDWLGHIVEGLLMAAILALLARSFLRWSSACLVGLAFAIGHFHGREKRDYEMSVAMAPPHLDAYMLWRWSIDQATDFWPIALLLLVLAIWLSRRNGL